MDDSPYQSHRAVEEYYGTATSQLTAEEIDRYHRVCRDGIKEIDLEYARYGFEGLEYGEFIQLHFRISSVDELLRKIAECFAAFTPVEREAAKEILQEYDQRALSRHFWLRDSASVLYEIGEYFQGLLTAEGHPAENRMKWNMFKLVSKNFAVIALRNKELREIAGIQEDQFLK